MANLMNKVGNYQLLLNELKDKENASRGTYMPGRHKTVGAIYTLVDPCYTHQHPIYQEENPCSEEITALELIGRNVAKSRSLKNAHKPVKISIMTFTKPEFETYTYNANKACEILDELISQNLIKSDFCPYPKPKKLKERKYCKFHNM